MQITLEYCARPRGIAPGRESFLKCNYLEKGHFARSKEITNRHLPVRSFQRHIVRFQCAVVFEKLAFKAPSHPGAINPRVLR